MKVFTRALAILGLVLPSGVVIAAPPAEVKLDIRQQPIRTALAAFSNQSGIQIVYPDDEVTPELISPTLVGSYAPRVALDRLLADTGLRYQYVNDRTVAIRRATFHEASTDSQVPEERLDSAQADKREMEGAETSRATDRTETGAKSKERIEEVVVSAQKREERLLDVPQSVSILSSENLSKLAATSFQDFADTVPGLSFQTAGPGFTQISLRGVTAGLDVSPTVGVYVDDVPYGSSTSFARASQITLDAALFDIDRIEVLRGPQGTLYGASTMGGLIKYVIRAPELNEFGQQLLAGVSGIEHGAASYNIAGVLNIPIVLGKFAARASAYDTHNGGYIDNVALNRRNVNSSDLYGGRFDLLLESTDRLSFRLVGVLQNTSVDGFQLADYTLEGEPVNGSLDQSSVFPESLDQRFRLVSGTFDYNFERAALTSISSYQEGRNLLHYDYSKVLVPVVGSLGFPVSAVAGIDTTSTDKFTQEVRLASQGRARVEWLVGLFYTREKSKQLTDLELRDLAGAPTPNNLLTGANPSTYEEHAAFGDLTWHWTDRFSVTGGLRYAHNSTKFAQTQTGLLGLSAPETEADDDVVTYLANARYQFTDHASAYARYATGYRPGGPNFVVRDPTTGVTVGLPTFEADKLKSYEIGFKAETADRRLGFDAAAYYIDWDNIQVTITQAGFGARANAPGGAQIRGSELNVYVRPIPAFTASAAIAYQDAEMAEAAPALRAAKGEPLPNVPPFTAALNAEYQFPVDSLQPWIGTTVRYVDARWASFDDSRSLPQYRLPAYTTADLRAGLTFDSVELQLYVHNLFDERGQLIPRLVFFPVTGPVQASIIQPRTVGLQASVRF